MNNTKARLIKLLIGTLLATLPFFICWGLADLLLLTGRPATGELEQQDQRQLSGTVVLIGGVMSAVALCGMGLYALDMVYQYAVVQRHARKIEKLRREGKI